MENENLHGEIVVEESRKLHTVLTFQDFVIEEGKKGKHETKKSKPIKTREEFTNDVEEDIIPTQNLGMQGFLLLHCLINKKEVDISGFSRGDYEALKLYLADKL